MLSRPGVLTRVWGGVVRQHAAGADRRLDEPLTEEVDRRPAGWDADSVNAAYRRMEDFEDGASYYHGAGGPLPVWPPSTPPTRHLDGLLPTRPAPPPQKGRPPPLRTPHGLRSRPPPFLALKRKAPCGSSPGARNSRSELHHRHPPWAIKRSVRFSRPARRVPSISRPSPAAR